ncbi:energy transducer TonB [Flavobacterium sp. N1994]|uniref:energy transducer TonB n=1 Tax=Flavobacterium sp. N1994 TaxID=2986827 RepID=UPI0022236D09|nr:energy transducer TonB [Flavobacterium sp. N1994]
MSNVSIYEKNWIDLVFEDKNKLYGAYQLRQENSRTSLLALFVGILFILTLLGSWMLFSSFGNQPDVAPIDDNGVVITLSDYNTPKDEEPKKEAVAPLKKEEETKKIDKKDLVHPTLVKAEDNPDAIKSNKELKDNSSDTKTDGTDTGVTSTNTSGSTSSVTTITKPAAGGGNNPVKTYELDRLPEYPEGMKKFYEYVGNSIDKSEIDSSISVSVIMSFIIEKDGSMTDIKVLRSTDKNLEKEAIRVLRALRIKWSPGVKDGEKVRTLYTLPIKVAF